MYICIYVYSYVCMYVCMCVYVCMYVSMNRKTVRVNSLFKKISVIFRRNLYETLGPLPGGVRREVSCDCVPWTHISHVDADTKTW
jgi:hypothetical protein